MNVKNNRLNRETNEKIIRTVYAMMTQQHRSKDECVFFQELSVIENHRFKR